jgi:signal transduction histidine kinase
MRERAASTGGRIDVDSDDTLFTLRARLPVKGRAAR